MKQFIIREQVENKGFYIKISFNVERLNEQKSKKIEIDYKADIKWKVFCETGILLFFEYFSRNNNSGLKIEIYEIDWFPVDTNSILVLYSTIKALSDAMDIDIKGLNFDLINGRFIFPDVRMV